MQDPSQEMAGEGARVRRHLLGGAARDDLPARGYRERGTTITPFGMVVLNDLDWFHPVNDVIDRVTGGLATHATCTKQALRDQQ